MSKATLNRSESLKELLSSAHDFDAAKTLKNEFRGFFLKRKKESEVDELDITLRKYKIVSCVNTKYLSRQAVTSLEENLSTSINQTACLVI